MHDLGEANDNFFHRPPEGRDLPDVEARRAMAKLQELGVQRYVFCHLEKQHCTKMTELLREILREDGKDKTAEESSWLVDTEVTRDPGEGPSASGQARLAAAAVSAVVMMGLARVARVHGWHPGLGRPWPRKSAVRPLGV